MKVVGRRDVDNGSQATGSRFELRREYRRVRLRLCNAFRSAGVRRGVEPICHPRTDRVQIDIGHGGENRAVVAECLALVAPLPESPFAAVLAIRPSCDRFDQAAHEP